MQSLTFTLGTSQVEVVTARIDIFSNKLASLAKTLSPAEIQRAKQFKFEDDQARYIFVRGLLRELVGIRISISPHKIHFLYGEFGKPFLNSNLMNSSIYFNLSHSKNYTAFVFSKSCEVGIDIEAISEKNDRDAIAKQIFSQNEFSMYDALPETSKNQGFLNCWTRKEAFVKAVGAGLNYALNSFDVSLVPEEPARIIAIRNPVHSQRSWFMESFTPATDHIGCIVAIQH